MSSKSPQPLRLVFAAPPGSDGSRTSTASHSRAHASIVWRDVPLPISSSVVHSIVTCGASASASSRKRANREHRDADAGLHVEDAGTVQPAGFLANRHAIELADRPDGVEVAEQQDAAPDARKLGADVIAAGAAVEARDRSADRFEAPRQLRAAPIHGGLVGAGRFERDEGLDGFAHPDAARLAPGQKI